MSDNERKGSVRKGTTMSNGRVARLTNIKNKDSPQILQQAVDGCKAGSNKTDISNVS
jgi:hypothetical protein